MIKYYCPKCNSKDTEVTNITPQPEDKYVSLDEAPDEFGPRVTSLVYKPQTYRAFCNHCFYSKEFTK